MNKQQLLWISVFIITIWVIIAFKQCNKSLVRELTQASLYQDSLRIYRNKDSSQTALIQSLQTEKVSTFLEIKTKDSSIIALQKEVERVKSKLRAGSSVSTARVDTKVDITVPNNDSIPTSLDSLIGFPVIEADINQFGEWITGKITISNDSTNINLNVKHEFTVVVGSESNGLFKPRVPYAELTSKNPFDHIVDFRTYQVTVPKSNTIKILGIGVGIGLIGGILLIK